MSPPVPALLVPPVRLGRLLREAREVHGESIPELVRRSGLAFDEAWFTEVEDGRVELDEPLVRWLGELYGVRAGELAPARSQLVIDLDEGFVAAGGVRLGVGSPGGDQILVNYLALVYLLRDLPAGTPIPLRDVDIAVLAQALQQPAGDIRVRLGRLIADENPAISARSRLLRRRVVVPVAGILVGLTAVGGLLLVRSTRADADGSDQPPAGSGPATVANEVPVEIGDAIVLEPGSVQHAR